MSELRWNPLLGTYTMVASNRQGRPQMPKDWCPFCPGSGKVPEHYNVLMYPNDFPALSATPPTPEVGDLGPYHAKPSHGACEVILFSPDHNGSLYKLPIPHLIELIDLWAERFALHSQNPLVKYIFEFENRGEEVGVTMPHPHGQLYAYPFLPQKIEVELQNAMAYFQQHGRNLFNDMLAAEKQDGRRILFENETFVAYLPYFTDYPYGAFIQCKTEGVGNFTQFSQQEKSDLAQAIKLITGGLDTLFNRPFPYMMCIHQNPVNSPEFEDWPLYYRFHIEFYPILRDANRIKFYAGSEMGAWAAANTRAVEDTAEEFRQAIQKFEEGKN